jgi:hypothetical protein
MKKLSLVLVIGLGLVLMAGGAFAAPDVKTLTVNATVNARATLSLGVNTINFPDGDPDVGGGEVTASEGAVSVTAKVRTGAAQTATLTVKAPDFLTPLIPSSQMRWTAAGAPFISGTMSTTDVSAATFPQGSGSYTSSFTYYFRHEWDDPTGSYQTIATYTLTAP